MTNLFNKEEFILYCIVMSLFCVPLFFAMLISINNKNRQEMFGEDPKDQVGCLQMIFVTLARIVLTIFPWVVAGIFINEWSEWIKNPTDNPIFIAYTVALVFIAAVASKLGSTFKRD